MKNQTIQSTKFLRLKRRLKLPIFQVVGLLESLWILTATNTPDGAIGKRSNEDIAAFLEWDDDHDSLIEHLVETGWIDKDPIHRLVIHDWFDHAPKWVLGMLKSPVTKKGYRNKKKGEETDDASKALGECKATLSEAPTEALGEACAAPSETPSEAHGATLLNQYQNQYQYQTKPIPNQELLAQSPALPNSALVASPDTQKQSKSKPKPKRPPRVDPANVGEVVLSFSVVGDKNNPTWDLRQGFVDDCQADFPGVNVLEHFRAAHRWVKSHDDRRKTADGMRKFLYGWIERNMNGPRASSTGFGAAHPPRETMVERLAKRFANIGGTEP